MAYGSVPYVPDPDIYVKYYLEQAGGGNQVYYRGTRLQRGYGIGSIFSRLFRFAMPLLKRGASHVGQALARTGANVALDAAAGSDVKESAKEHLKTMGRRLVGDAAGYVKDQVGDGRKRGVKRKRSVDSRQSKRSRPRAKVDIFTS